MTVRGHRIQKRLKFPPYYQKPFTIDSVVTVDLNGETYTVQAVANGGGALGPELRVDYLLGGDKRDSESRINCNQPLRLTERQLEGMAKKWVKRCARYLTSVGEQS